MTEPSFEPHPERRWSDLGPDSMTEQDVLCFFVKDRDGEIAVGWPEANED